MSDALTLYERAEIIDTCIQMAWCIDERRWEDLGELFAPTLVIDYTSIFGGEPRTITPADMVRTSQLLLGNLTSTQHIVSGHIVTGSANDAECKSQVQATHLLANPSGDPAWTVGAQYYMKLRRLDGSWRISAVRAVMLWAAGNREVMRLGKVRGQSA